MKSSFNRPVCRKVLDCASPLALFVGLDASESARGLAQSKTLSRGFWPRCAIRSSFLQTILLLFSALCPAPARADAVLNDCSQPALESALLVGGLITVNCDGTLLISNTVNVASDAILDASGHNLTISSFTGANAPNAVRLFNVNPGVSFSLVNLSLTGGRGATNGGAIYNDRGFLSLTRCVLSNNLALGGNGGNGARGKDSDHVNGASGKGGGNGRGAYGAAIYNFHGTTVVSRCSFLSNSAFAGNGGAGGNGGSGRVRGGDGGNGGNGAKAQGGAIYNSGWLAIDTSTFMLNSVIAGTGGPGGTNGTGFAQSELGHGGSGGVAGGGAIYNLASGTVNIVNSTFSLNSAFAGDCADAGSNSRRANSGKNGPSCVGGAIANYGSSALVNSTFFANKTIAGAGGNGASSNIKGGAGGAGGAAWGGNVYNAKRTAVTNCTFFDGGATGGTNGLGGAALIAGKNGRPGASRGGNVANGNGSFRLKNSIVAFPLPGANGYGAFTDNGYNLSSDKSIRLKGAGSMINTDPRIGLLGRNGGPTETIPLFSDSPAIDAGDPASSFAADQRGVPRPYGARGDIGAYEFGLTLLPPVVTSPPQSQTAQAGATVTFIVVVSGDPPLTYSWRRGGNAIPAAAGPVLTLNNVQSSDAGSYDVVISNNSGSVTSSNATLTLISRVAISVQPADMTVAQGGTTTFRVAASGDTPISYQWFYNRTNPIYGATLNVLTLANIATNQAGAYSVRVANPFSFVESAAAVLTVNTVAPVVSVQPQSITVLPDESASFTVEVIGSLPLQYLWFHNGTNLVGSFLLNSNRSTLFLPSVQLADVGLYSAVITNISGSTTSETAALALDASMPIIALQPASLTVPQGQIATFRVSATGTAPIFYQWFFNGSLPIPGATGPVLTIPNVGDPDAGSYHVVVSNRFGAVPSDAATLTVTFAPPEITTQPTNLTVFSGENATFVVVATGSAPLSYQWFLNDLPLPGATSPSLTITNVNGGTDGGDYFVIVSNPAGSTNSDLAKLIINDAAPMITLQPTNMDVLLGSNVTFSVSAIGSLPLRYQWFLNDMEISGATNATLVLSNLAVADAGEYRVTIYNPNTDSTGMPTDSDVATLTLLAPITAFSCTPPNPDITCTISYHSEVGTDYTLQWYDSASEQWIMIGDIQTGDGTTMQFIDMPSTTATQSDYRIVVEVTPVQ